MKFGKLLAATALAAFATTAANASSVSMMGPSTTTFDFVDEAAGNERGVADGEVVSFAGGDLTFTATGPNGSAFAYFDDLSFGRPGGLGACSVLDANDQCAPSSDDNVTEGESIQINFGLLEGGAFNVNDISFYGTIGDTEHVLLDEFDGLVRIITSTGFDQTLTFATAASTFFGLVEYIRFEFVDTDFYVSSVSDVPVPAALPLLLSGIAGLRLASRRRKTA